MQQANGTNTKKKKRKKNGRPVLEKKTFQKTFFTSVLTISRKISQKIKGQQADKMCQLIFLKIYPQQQKQ